MLVQDENKLSLSGDLTRRSVSELFNRPPKFEGKSYSLDLTEVKAVDSAGVSLLLHWNKQAKAASALLVLQNPPEFLINLLKLYNAEQLFELQ